MACECNYVMLSVCIILFLGVAAQTLSFALPGWTKWSPREDVSNATTTLYFKDKVYSSGLWVECEADFKECGDWIEKATSKALGVAECTADEVVDTFTGGKGCRNYNNIEITIWVTQTLGLFFLVFALILAILASMAMCCGDCCVGFCKFFVLLVCMLASMSITIGVTVFGVGYAEDKYNGEIVKQGRVVEVDSLQLYYGFALAVVAAVMALLGAIISAFSSNDDGKP